MALLWGKTRLKLLFFTTDEDMLDLNPSYPIEASRQDLKQLHQVPAWCIITPGDHVNPESEE